ncbi:MAG: FIST C-terminal domain-containing protein [Rhodocyclaceae bacterium]|jgi:small ligand-binding sensory domain FIST|nr:FIST C-terminal domain-containing protein [Rhodocyclaceae bacterium]
MRRAAATGFASAASASPELAAEAVRAALSAVGCDYAHSLLLLLSAHFSNHTQPAVNAASRTARCLQVSGCTVPGLFTAEDWALDQPAAAALVLCGPICLSAVQPAAADGGIPLLTLSKPEVQLGSHLKTGPVRYGTLSTGSEGVAGGDVWSQCRLRSDGHAEARFLGARTAIGVSRGLRVCSPPLQITGRMGFELFTLSHRPALDSLLEVAPGAADETAAPHTRYFAAVLETGAMPELALEDGRYALVPIIGVNPHEKSVTLAARLPDHAALVWVRHDPETAAADSLRTLQEIGQEAPDPEFALMFSCIGRGPYFSRGADRDLALLQERYPDLPVLGAYGAGEIGPVAGENLLLSYSTVYALFSAES